MELDSTFFNYIKYRYGIGEVLFIVPKNFPGASSIKRGETYWVREDFTIIETEYIAYQHDYSSRDDLDWRPASEITKDLSRYGIECIKIEKKKLSNVNKTELIKSGVLSGDFEHRDDNGLTNEFKTRPIEFWRFQKRLSGMIENFEWNNKTDMFVFHFKVHPFKPTHKIYDWMVEEKLNYKKQEKEIERRLREQSEKEAESPKKKRKKKTGVKKKRKTSKKVNSKKKSK